MTHPILTATVTRALTPALPQVGANISGFNEGALIVLGSFGAFVLGTHIINTRLANRAINHAAVADSVAMRLVEVGRGHHLDHVDPNGIVGAAVPADWTHDTGRINILPDAVPDVPQVKSMGIVERVVNQFTRKDVLEDLAKTMLAAAADEIDQIGELRVSRSLYLQIKLWAARRYVETKKQKAFVLRCLYRFQLTNDLAHLFKMLNPRPFGLTSEARISIQTEFGKMMKEINRLMRDGGNGSASIPDEIVRRYEQVSNHDRKFHEWACVIGPSLVIARSKTQDLADKLWEMAVADAANVGASW